MKQFFCLLTLGGLVPAALAAWTNVPTLTTNPPKSQFASYELYFSDSDYEMPYYLKHFSQIANAVVESGFYRVETNGTSSTTVTNYYPPGFLDIRVNREPRDNRPYNARIMEMQVALAYFYTVNRPWNVYRGNANVRVRLEEMLKRWVLMQNSDGLFAEYSANNWSLAPTGFGVMSAAQTLDLIQDSGQPFDAVVMENARIALRKSLLALFTRSDMQDTASSYSNQFSGAYHAALLYLENWPDAELNTAFVAAVNAASGSDQSPIGYFYEADGPDFGYSGVHERNLRVALPRLRSRTNDLLPVIVADEERWAAWLGANLLLQPNLSTPTFLINAGINTRTSTSYQTPESRPLSEFATNSRAFSYTDTEFTNSVRAKTDSLASTPTYGTFTTNNAYSYVPTFVLEGLEKTETWHPTSAQRTTAMNLLPYLASARFNRILNNATGNKELTVATFRRPTYYGLFNSGRSKVNQQKFGLGMLWNPSYGTALQAIAGGFTNSISTSWGTSRTNMTRVYEQLADEKTLGAVFRLNNSALSLANGTNNVADGTVTATYNLVDGTSTNGSKVVSFEESRIKVDVTHTNAFTERLPLIAPTSATLTTATNQLTLAHTNGSRLILRLLSGGTFTVAPSDTTNLPSGLQRRAVTVSATNSLSYELFITSDAFQAGNLGAPISESYAPANGGPDVGETVTFNLPLVNLLGASTTTNFNATLLASNGVIPITTNRAYGAVPGGATASQPFTLSVSGKFGDPLILTLTLRDGTNNYGTVSCSTLIGGMAAALTTTNWQNFDGVSAPALPAGWTSGVPTGTAGGWTTSTSSPNTAPNSVSAVPTGSISEQRLDSSAFTIPSGSGEPEIRFQHRWDTENTYDGGVLEISVDGGSLYQDILSAGGSFLSGGYSGTLNSGYQNPLGGRQAWYGSNNSAYTLTRISLPSSMLGKSVRLRFRLGCDSSVAGTIWRIDTLQFVYKAPNYIQPAEITSAAPSGAFPVGLAYTHTFTAVGQPAPTFTVTSGTLPAGLSLSPSGVLSGTVTNTFTSRTITVAANNGVTPVRTNGSQSFTLGASVPISISTTSPLATGTTGSSYAQTLAATGGQEPYTWSLSSGSLPPGLALSGGSISGTPLAAGTYNFIIAVTDSASATASKNFSIVVTNPAALSVVTPSLPGAQVGSAYSQLLAAVSGTAPYTWSRDSGTLPPGLSLVGNTGVFSGNPTTAGTYNFVLRVTDATSSASTTRSFSITVTGNLLITTAPFPDARSGSPYLQTLAATGGTGSRTWTVSSGTLPPGLSLLTNGVISGNPSTMGFYEFTIQVEDSGGSAATKVMSITSVNTLTWDSDPGTAGIQSSNGTWTTASGTTNWSLSGGNVAWVDGSDGVINGGTLTLGSPIRVSGLVFSNTAATISGANILSVDSGSTITTAVDTAIAAPLSGLSFTKAGTGRLTLSNATYGGDVNISAGELRLNEPAGERTWSGTISGGGAFTAVGSGRVTLGGANTFTGQARLSGQSVWRLAHGSALGATNGNTRLDGDSNNAPGIELIGGITVPEPFQLIMWTASVINTNTNHAQIRNVAGTNELTGQLSLDAGGGRWDISSDSGHLKISGPVVNIAQRAATNADTWRTLHLRGEASGEITGPMADATNNFSKLNITVLSGTWTLGGSNKTYTGATIISNGTLGVTSTLNSEVRLAGGNLTGQGGTSSNLIVSNSGTFWRGWTDWNSPGPAFTAAQIRGTNNASLRVLLDGSGLTNFSETTNTIPVIAATNGVTGLSLSNLSVDTTNFPGKGSWSLSTNTTGLLASYSPDSLRVLSSNNLSGGTNATVYNTQLVAAGGVAPRSWSIPNPTNALPQGLTLQEDGWLSGTPLSSGTFHFEAVLTDSTGRSITNAFSLTVANPPLIAVTTSLQPTTAGQNHSESLQAAGGSAPYTWRLVSGSLPTGLSLSAEGLIVGKPSFPGKSVFTVSVTDGNGSVAETILSLEVAAAPGTYAAWVANARWPDADSSALSADPDGDGLPNLTEYAMGSSPLQAEENPLNSSLTNISGQNYLVLKFRRSATAHDTTLEVLASTNLTDWTSQAQGTGTNGFILMYQGAETSITESDVDQTGSFREVTFRDGAPVGNQSKKFLRLKISE